MHCHHHQLLVAAVAQLVNGAGTNSETPINTSHVPEQGDDPSMGPPLKTTVLVAYQTDILLPASIYRMYII